MYAALSVPDEDNRWSFEDPATCAHSYWFDATAGQGRVALPTASQTILERPKATIAPHKVMQNAMVDALRMVNGGNFLLDSRKRV